MNDYYEVTRVLLEPIFEYVVRIDERVEDYDDIALVNCIDYVTEAICRALCESSNSCVPAVRCNSLKFWWTCELSELKRASITADLAWKLNGKPRSGPIFQERQSSRLQYRRGLRQGALRSKVEYSNALHDSLMQKIVHHFGNRGTPN